MATADRIVYFSYDSTNIVPESRTIIENNARSLTKNPQMITQLEGHTDERGSREYNIALGERRANAVRQTMIAMGFRLSRSGSSALARSGRPPPDMTSAAMP